MTDKEILVNMLREAVKKRYEQAYYVSDPGEYYNEFEEMYFLEDENAVHIYNADDNCVNIYFDKNGKINLFN
jgi:hypothetical protein